MLNQFVSVCVLPVSVTCEVVNNNKMIRNLFKGVSDFQWLVKFFTIKK